jgi:hypothetical protein
VALPAPPLGAVRPLRHDRLVAEVRSVPLGVLLLPCVPEEGLAAAQGGVRCRVSACQCPCWSFAGTCAHEMEGMSAPKWNFWTNSGTLFCDTSNSLAEERLAGAPARVLPGLIRPACQARISGPQQAEQHAKVAPRIHHWHCTLMLVRHCTSCMILHSCRAFVQRTTAATPRLPAAACAERPARAAQCC